MNANAPRRSPYLFENLMKSKPQYLLSTERFQNNIKIECPRLSQVLTYKHYSPTVKIEVEEEAKQCGICQLTLIGLKYCNECRRIICPNCQRYCGSCGHLYCKLEVKYDYSKQIEQCLNCEKMETQ